MMWKPGTGIVAGHPITKEPSPNWSPHAKPFTGGRR